MIETESHGGADFNSFGDTYDIPAGSRDVVIALTAEWKGEFKQRGYLVSYKFLDSLGNECIPDGNFVRSPTMGLFFYLGMSGDTGQGPQPIVEAIPVPTGATRLSVRGRSWLRGAQAAVHDSVILFLDDQGLSADLLEQSDVPPWVVEQIPGTLKTAWARRSPDRGPAEPGNTSENTSWSIYKEILGRPRALDVNRDSYRHHGEKLAHRFKVAIICDEFTHNSFSPEFEAIVLEPKTWRDVLAREDPDFLFCESAWSGVDSSSRPWRGQIYASARFKRENRGELLSILEYCRQKAIPTVFWNKEDPTHFHDRVNDFVSTASKFDYVLTTAEEMVEEYEKFMPAGHVGVLQFAAQPRDFNPLSGHDREDRAIFAGAWYDVHPRRSDTMREGFDKVIATGRDLQIYDRNLRSASGETNFPEKYAPLVRPAVTHKATAKLYRTSTIGLNINTVTDSATMFARRVFELAASGALVVSNRSPGIERIYGDSAVFYDGPEGSLSELTDKDIRDKAAKALRITLHGHTYRHRFEEVLRHLGMRFTSSRPAPTMMVTVASHEQAAASVAAYRRTADLFSRLLLVVSRDVPTAATGRFLTDYQAPDVDVVQASLVETERVPSTNFVRTPDVFHIAPGVMPTAREVEGLFAHGEYTRHVVVAARDGEYGMSAGPIADRIARIAATDVIDVIGDPHTVRPHVKVVI